jgi:DNA-binding transcriptional LysR family regulator
MNRFTYVAITDAYERVRAVLLRQLEYLSALAHEQHFGNAATMCHVSQPALSNGLRKLEIELGVQIVERGQKFQGFTTEGAAVLEWAQRLLADHDTLLQTLAMMRTGLTGTLRIGAIPTALTVTPLVTAPLHKKHPMVDLSLISMSSREIVTRLNDFDIDVGMTYVDGEPLGKARTIALYREQYVFLTPEDGEFADRIQISWTEAGTTQLCQLSPDMQNRRIIDGFFAEAGAETRVVVETDTIATIYNHVSALGLSSVIPHAWMCMLGIPEGTRVIKLPAPRRSYHVGFALASHHPGSLVAQALIDASLTADINKQLNRATAKFMNATRVG